MLYHYRSRTFKITVARDGGDLLWHSAQSSASTFLSTLPPSVASCKFPLPTYFSRDSILTCTYHIFSSFFKNDHTVGKKIFNVISHINLSVSCSSTQFQHVKYQKVIFQYRISNLFKTRKQQLLFQYFL